MPFFGGVGYLDLWVGFGILGYFQFSSIIGSETYSILCERVRTIGANVTRGGFSHIRCFFLLQMAMNEKTQTKQFLRLINYTFFLV